MKQFFADASEYNYSYQAASATVDAGTISTIIFIIMVFCVIGYMFNSYMLGRIFAKASVPVWKAWVPVYNNWVSLQLGGQQGFWAILALVPVVQVAALVFFYMAMYRIGLKFNKPGEFVLLAIFAPIVWLVWLAFDKSKWQGKKLGSPKSKAKLGSA